MKRCVAALLLVVCLFSCALAEEVKPSDMIGKDTNLIFIADMPDSFLPKRALIK